MSFQVLFSITVYFLVFSTGKCAERIQTRIQDGICNQPGGSLPDTTDCKSFWVCESLQHPVQYLCPTGEFFNPATHRCAADYDCPSGQVCNASGELHPNQYNCASYFLCDSALNAILVTCGEDQFYDDVSQTCKTNTVVNCHGRPGCFYPGQTFPDVENCKTFYVCDATLTPKRYYCLNDVNFDSVSYQCLESAVCP